MTQPAGVMPSGRDLTLQQAADELGVHYMTAYRYVRTGRLPARRVASGWRIAPSDLAAIVAAGDAAAAGPVGSTATI